MHHPPEMPLWLTLLQLQRLRRRLRQAHVSRQWLGSRRLQKSWNELQHNEAGDNDDSSFGHKLPPNPQSHASLSIQLAEFSPAFEKRSR